MKVSSALSHFIATLLALTTVTACMNPLAPSQKSSVATSTYAPYLQTPDPFSITALTASTSSVSIAFSSSNRAKQYDLYQGTSSNTETLVASSITSPYTVTGLTNGTAYYFKLKAVNDAGSVFSNERFGTPIASFNASGASPGLSKVTVTWPVVAGATSYTLVYGTTTGTYTSTASNVTSPYQVTSLTNGTPYFFRVIAQNVNGQVSSSNELTATPVSSGGPPTSVIATTGAGQIGLSWTAPVAPGPITYNVLRSTSTSGPYTQIATNLSALTYTDSSVADGTPYYYVLTETNPGGTSANSVEVSGQTIAPFALTSVTVSSGSALSIAWPSPAGAATYALRYGTVNGTYGTLVSANATSPVVISSLTPGTTYYFMVTASNTEGSGVSQNASSSASGIPISAFTMGSVTQNGLGQVSVPFAAATGSSSYTVKYGTTSGSYPTTFSTTAVSPMTVTGLTSGTPYYFMVSAVNSNGSLNASTEQTFTPIAVPGNPSSLTATASPGSVALAWTPSTGGGAITYTVSRGTASGGPYTALASGITAATYTDATVTDGTSYYYVVKATNIAGTTANSNEAAIRTLSAFTITSVTVNGSGSLSVAWPVVAGAASYTLKYGTVNGTYGTLVSSSASSPTTVSSLTPGTTYYFMVTASNAIGSGSSQNATSSVSGIPMNAFTLSSAAALSTQTTLTWTASTGSTSYSILYGTASGTYTTTLTGQTSPATITGLTNGNTYYWLVRAVNASGTLDASPELSSQPIAAPTIPASLTGVGTHNQTALSWSASTGPGTLTYNVYRSLTSGSAYTKISSAQAGTSFNDNTAVDGTLYYYVVSAQSAGGESAYSNEVDVQPINNFSLTSAVAGASSVDLTWALATGATQYDIHYGTTSLTYTNSVTNQVSPKSVVGFTPGTPYYFSVTATNAHHGIVVATNELSATPMSAFLIGAITQTGPGQIQIPWATSTGATSYNLKYGSSSGTYTTTLTNQTSPVTISGLVNGNTYYVMVTASNASGTINATTEQSITLLTAPNAPTSVLATAATAQSTLTWVASTGSGTITYNVLRSTTSGSGYTAVASGLSTLTYNDTGLTNGTIYYYVVQAQNVGGTVNSSEVAAQPIAAFTISSVVANSTQASLAWSAATGASNYVLNYGTATGSYTILGGTTGSTSATIAGINSPVQYFFMVTATNTHGGSVNAGGEVSATSISPFTLSSVTQTGAGQAQLAWTTSGGASAYAVKYGTTTGTYTTTLSNQTSPATITGLTPGTQYFFMVTASNANNGLLNGTPELNLTPYDVPTVPGTLTGVATSGQVALNWGASTGGGTITYNVLRSTTSGSGYASVASGVTGTSYTDISVTNGTTYYYVVTSANVAGPSAYSNQVTASPIAIPSTPTTLTGQGTHNQSTLAWTASTGPGTVTYNIYRSLTSGSGYSKIASSVATNAYSDATANDGTIYYYVVSAQNAGGETAYSNEVDVQPINSFLLGTATSGISQIALTWGTATGATQYDVKYGTATGTYGTTLSNQSSPKTISALTPGTTYYLSVTATNVHHGLVIATNELTAVPMSAFTISSVTQTAAGQVQIAWGTSTGSNSYTVSYGTATGVYGTTASSSATSPLTVNGLTNGSTYYFMVTAVNANGQVNATTEQSITLLSPPSVPVITAIATSEQVALTWPAATGSGTITYNVLRSTTSGSGYLPVAAGTGISTNSFTDTSLTDGVIYYYVVNSSNIGGNSANSAQVAGEPIAPFTITSATGGVTQVVLNWAAAAGATNYNITYGTSSGTWGSSGGSSATTTKTVTGLTGGTTYYFMVTATNAANGSVAAPAEVSAAAQTGFTYTWPFTLGTDANYSFDSTKTELVGGVARLKNQTPGDYSNSSTSGFAAGTLNGLIYDTTNAKLKLDPNTVNSGGELSNAWTPQYSSLVAYWKLNGTSGGNATQGTVMNASVGPDAIFQNPDASVYPTTGFVFAKQKQGLILDGVNDYLKLPNDATFDFGTTNSFSVSMWAKWTTISANQRLFSTGGGGSPTSTGFSIVIASALPGSMGFGMGDGSSNTQTVSIGSTASNYNDGAWHFITVTADQSAKKLSLYMDGASVPITKNGLCGTVSGNSLNYTGCAATAIHSQFPSIGSYAGGSPFKGSLDEVAVWRTALSANDVKTIYDRQNSAYTGTILSRVMDQGASTSWTALNWLSSLPFGKELTPNLTSDLQTAYPSLPQGNLASGLQALWHMDEQSGTTLTDASGNGANGVYSNSPTLGASGALNTAVTFAGNNTGTNQIANITSGNATALNIGGALTVSAWVLPQSVPLTAGSIIRDGLTGDERYGIVMTTTKQLQYTYYTGTTFSGVTSPANVLTLGVLQHVVMTRAADGVTVTFYVNGVQVSSGVASSIPTSSGTPAFSIGAVDVSGQQFPGTIDEVGVWNRVLTTTEISQLAQRNSGLMLGNIGLWHLNEAAGTSGANSIIDSSGTGSPLTPGGTGTLGSAGRFNTAFTGNGTNSYLASAAGSTYAFANQTFSVSLWYKNFTTGFLIGNTGAGCSGWMINGASNNLTFSLKDSGCYGTSSSVAATPNDGSWHHLVAVIHTDTTTEASNTIQLFYDGVAGAVIPGNFGGHGAYFPAPATSALTIGARNYPTPANFTDASIDEVGIWGRALSTAEVLSIYQRGANRVKLQARVCTSADCSDDPTGANFKGPDGSNQTYFTENFNASTQAATPSGNILTTSPAMLFTNFFGNLTSQYFQYKAILESDSLPSTFTPDITTVSTGPVKYDGSRPIIIPIDGPSFLTLSAFTQTLGGGGCSGTPLYQLSRDKTTWYYLNGTVWTTTTNGYAEASTAAAINTNISFFPTSVGTGKLYVKAFLPSSTSTACEIDSLAVTGGDTNPTNSSNPQAFQITSTTVTGGQITVNYSASTNATNYKVCYGTTQALANACATFYNANTATTATITGLTNGTPYYVTVIASDASGTTSTIPNTPTVVTPIASPSTPTSLAAASGLSSVSLTWTASTGSGNITYNVLRSTTSGSGYTTQASGLSSPAFTDFTALNGTTYYYVVSASNAGGTSANSSEVSAKAIGSFTVTALATNGQVTLTWGAASGATAGAYKIQYGTTSNAYSTTLTSQTSPVTIPSLTNNTIYYFLVTATNGSGSANASAEITGQPVGSFVATAGTGIGQASLSWTAGTGATNYNVRYGTAPGTYTTTSASVTSPITIPGLTGGTTYYISVQGYNVNNGTYFATEVSTTVQSAVSYTWPFTAGTDTNYSFDSNKVELVGGVARLKNQTPGDSSNSSTVGFAAGTLSGLIWDAANSKLKLDTNTANTSGELNGNWTPQYDKIVGYWKLNGTAGNSIAQGTVIPAAVGLDGIFENTNGSTAPTTGFSSAKQNQGITFDGVDDYINFGNVNTFDFGTSNSFSLGAWFMNSSAGGNIFLNGSSSYALGYSLSLGSGQVNFLMGGGSQSTSVWPKTVSTYNDGKWHHVVVSVDQTAKTISIYVDGIAATLTTGAYCGTASGTVLTYTSCTSASANHTAKSTIASNNGATGFLTGTLDEVAIWKTALTAQNVKTIYERQNANYTGTILSRVIDQGASSTWTGLSWLSTLPFGKELAPNRASEDGYSYSANAFTNPATPLAYYRFEETAAGSGGAGNDFADSSGNGVYGTSTGSTTTYAQAGKFGNTALFNGSYVNATLPAGSFASNVATVSFWMKWNGTDDMIPFGFNAYGLWLRAGSFGFNSGNSDIYGISSSGFANTWVHVTAEMHASDYTLNKIWINGALQTLSQLAGSKNAANTVLQSAISIANWRLDTSHKFVGSIDEFAIWNRTLTAGEIASLDTHTSNLGAGLVGLWHLNETSGTSAVDSSGNSNTATYAGTYTLGSQGKFNTAVTLNGTSGSLSIPASTSLNSLGTAAGGGAFTLSSWVYLNAYNSGSLGSIFNARTGSSGYSLSIGGTGFQTGKLMLWESNGLGPTSTTSMALNTWYHIVATGSGTTTKLYINGNLEATSTGISWTSGNNLYLGSQSSTTNFHNGLIDEAGVWNRALSTTEITSLYQRGANRVKLQARVCTAADCSDDPSGTNFKGPDGTNGTYFTEAFNMSTQAATPSGSVLTTSPSMLFTNFFGNLTGQYYQYKAILESDFAPTTLSPDITAVSSGPAKYDASQPTIVPVDAASYLTLTGFSETLGSGGCAGTTLYQLSKDKINWYYLVGSTWTLTTNGYSNASSASTINTNISSFPTSVGTGKLYVKAFLPSNISTACEIDALTVTGGDTSPTTTTNPQAFQVTSLTNGPAQFIVTYTAATNATDYKVCYGTTQALANACGTFYDALTATTATVTGLTNGTQYYVTVVATSASGTTYSSPTTGSGLNTITPATPPTVPNSLVATGGYSNVSLTWTASTGSGAITYNVLRSTTSGSGYTTLASGITSASYTDLTSLNGTTYYYVVSASNNGGTSANSTQATTTSLGAFTISSVIGANGSAVVNWTAALGATATGYTVKWGSGSYNYSSTATGQSQASGYTITGLTNNTLNFVMVTATNATGAANAQTEIMVTPIGNFTQSALTATNTDLTVTWGAAVGANAYAIKYGTSSGTYTTTLSSQTSPATITGLTANTTYYVKVFATNGTNGANTSNETSATTTTVNGTNSTVVASPTTITADDTSTSTITVTVLNNASAPVAGIPITLSSSRGSTESITPGTATSNGSGVATFTVTSTYPGTPVFTAVDFPDSIVFSQTASITVNAVDAVHALASYGSFVWNASPGSYAMGTNGWGMNNAAFGAPNGMWVDASGNTYVADNSSVSYSIASKVLKYSSTGVPLGWIGGVGTVPTGGAAGCTSTARGIGTPGWCTGGSAATGNTINGGFGTAYGITGDATYIYVADSSSNRINKFNLSTGAFYGWTGGVGSNTGLATSVGLTNSCASTASGVLTPGWCTGGTPTNLTLGTDGALNAAVGITNDGTSLFVADLNNNRINRYDMTSGAYNGWIGGVAGISGLATAPGNTNTCASTLAGAATPGWCMGGSSASGTTDGFLKNPYGVTYFSGSIYVTDGSGKISQFNATTGAYVGWVGMIGSNVGLGGGTGCAGSANNTWTPNWCTGGTPSGTVGTTAGAMGTNARLITNDGTYLYAVDYGSSRVIKFAISNGAYAGWIGKIGSIANLGGGAGCSSAANNTLTPAWCTGGMPAYDGAFEGSFAGVISVAINGSSLLVADYKSARINHFNASTGAYTGWTGTAVTQTKTRFATQAGGGLDFLPTRWDQGFLTPIGLYNDGTNLYEVENGINGKIKKLNLQSGTFVGWSGAQTLFSTEPVAMSGPGTCSTTTNASYPGNWCSGGFTTYNAFSQGGLYNAGGIVGDGTYLYVTDLGNQSIMRYKTSDGSFQGWIGQVSSVSGIGMCSGASVGSFTPSWCTGGASTIKATGDGSMNSPYGIYTDNTYLYVTESGNQRVDKYLASTGAFYGWVGQVSSVTGIATATGSTNSCASATTGTVTPGWCTGGSSAVGTQNGAFNSPQSVTGDGTYLYVANAGAGSIEKINASTGAFFGWIGQVASTTSLATSSGLTNACASTTVGNITPGWCTGGTATNSGTMTNGSLNTPRGVTYNGGYIYVVDSSHASVKKFDATSGAYIGWKGLIGTVPTGGGAACTGASTGTFTLAWCTGGAPKFDQSTLGSLNYAWGINADAYYLYVTDINTGTIMRMTK